MDNDTPEPSDTPEAPPNKGGAFRDRLLQARAIAAQKTRAQSATTPLDDKEAARLVADFLAQGGQVTHCPPGEDEVPPAARKSPRG